MRLRNTFRQAARGRYHGKRFKGYNTCQGMRYDQPIQPKFWTGELHRDADDYTVDCSQYDLSGATPSELLAQMDAKFKNVGLVWLRNTGLTELDQMQKIAKHIVSDNMKYGGGANSRKGIIENVYETGAPKEAWLHYHHEMAYVGDSTSNIGFCCTEAVQGKGHSFVSDGTKTTEEILKTELGQKLKNKGVCYVRCLTDRRQYEDDRLERNTYNHWQRSFDVENEQEAQAKAEDLGLKVEWATDPLGKKNYMVTKFYVSAFEYCEYSDTNQLYSSVADDFMWFDSWPGVNELPIQERPLLLTFGDDTQMTYEERQLYVDVYDKYGIPIEWQKGDIAVMCNYRWAHGRPSYSLEDGERRELGVLLGKTFKRIGHREGKWMVPSTCHAETISTENEWMEPSTCHAEVIPTENAPAYA